MPPRTLYDNISLDHVRDELDYTEHRLVAEPGTRDLAAVLHDLAERLAVTEAHRKTALKALARANALVDVADDHLDDGTGDFARDVLHLLKGDRQHPRFTFYFRGAPSNLIRLGLASQLDVIRPWVGSLREEPEAQPQAYAERFAALIEEGDAALGARAEAERARAEQRVREILPIFDDVNAARRSLYATLVGRAVTEGRPNDWPERFFRHQPRPVKAPAAPAEA